MADSAGTLPSLIVPKHHKTLAMAFFEAQMEFGPIAADGLNPEKGYRFRSFTAIRDALAPILNKNGLAFTQLPDGVEMHDGRPTFMLKTVIIHAKTGAEMVARYPVCDARLDAHARAMCLTLARRYSLPTIMGVSAESEAQEPPHDAEGIDQRPADEIAEDGEPRSAFIGGEAWGLVAGLYTSQFDAAADVAELEKIWKSFIRKYWAGKKRCISENAHGGMEEIYERAKLRLEDAADSVVKLTAAITGAVDLSELEEWRARGDTEARWAKLSEAQQIEASTLYEAAQERLSTEAYAAHSASRASEPNSVGQASQPPAEEVPLVSTSTTTAGAGGSGASGTSLFNGAEDER